MQHGESSDSGKIAIKISHFEADQVLTVMNVHLPSQGWSPIIPRMVSHLQNYGYFVPKDHHPFSNGCSPSTLSMVNHYTQDSHALAEEWSTTIPGMVINFPKTVTHHFQDGQLAMEFDSSPAQLFLIQRLFY